MAPIVYVVRHAEGYHNVEENGHKIHDPYLTDHGKEQAQELCDKFEHHDKIDILIASPMVRTIQTCQIAFQPVVDRGQKIMLMPLAQEGSDTNMDTGSTPEKLKEIFGDLIDTHRLDKFPEWNQNEGHFAAEAKALIARGKKLRNALRERPEKYIALVSHGQFAHFIVGNVNMQGEETTRQWENTECRGYRFLAEDDEEAQMVELEETKQKHGELEKVETGYVLSESGVRKGSAGSIHGE